MIGTNRFARSLVVSLSAFTLMLGACADDETTTTPTPTPDATTGADGAADSTTGNDQGGAEVAECTDTKLTIDPLGALQDPEAGCTLSGDPTGNTYVVDIINIDTPDNAAVTGAINPLFENDMKAGDLIILFHVKSYDAGTGEAVVEAGTGLGCGTYTFDGPPSELTININGCDFTTTTTAPLELAPATVNKPIIVSSLDVAGSFSSDQSRILTATLSGALEQANASGLLVDLGPLGEIDMSEFLVSVGAQLDTDVDGDGTNDAWTLGGQLAAKKIDNFTPAQ